MELTEIIFRMFAWMRPLLWYYHRLGGFLRDAIWWFEDDDWCLALLDDPVSRARIEGMLVDAERCLDIAIGLRTRELLGLPMPATRRLGIGGFHRQHTPPSLVRLAARLDRLIDRHNAIERLAQLRARRLRREIAAAPVRLEADHRPARPALSAPSRRLAVSPFFVFPRAAAPTSPGLHIRAPP